MAKDKKKKKKDRKSSVGGNPARRLKSLSQNPLVADVVAAALVATASALKDSKKAQQLAASAGDELEKLSKKSAERGNAMWQLALDIGRRALDEIVGEKTPAKPPKAKSATARKARKSASSPKKGARKSTAKPSRAKRN